MIVFGCVCVSARVLVRAHVKRVSQKQSTGGKRLELSGTHTDSIAKPGITVRQIPGQVSPLQKSPLRCNQEQ